MSQIGKLTSWMRCQVGTAEDRNNHVRYNNIYWGYEAEGDSYPWCCAFIWVGFFECGLSQLFFGGGKTAYCPTVVNYAKQNGKWVTSGYREGDLLLYDWDGDGISDHIGYCIRSTGNKVTAIEGNCGDKVCEIERTMANIMGAYRPNYEDGPEENKDEPIETFCTVHPRRCKFGDVSESVRAMQILLMGRGYSVGIDGADGDFGGNTKRGLEAFQKAKGLPDDGICGDNTWSMLLLGVTE